MNELQDIVCFLCLLERFDHFVQVILAEEVDSSKLTLFDITKQICDAVQARAEQGLLRVINVSSVLQYLILSNSSYFSCQINITV